MVSHQLIIRFSPPQVSAHLLCAVVETMAVRQAEEAQMRLCFELINKVKGGRPGCGAVCVVLCSVILTLTLSLPLSKMIDADYEYLERHSNFLHLALQWDLDRTGNAGMLTMDGVQTFLDDAESNHPTIVDIPGGPSFQVPVPDATDLMVGTVRSESSSSGVLASFECCPPLPNEIAHIRSFSLFLTSLPPAAPSLLLARPARPSRSRPPDRFFLLLR